MIVVRVDSAKVSGLLSAQADGLRRPRVLLAGAAQGVRRRLQRHFRERDTAPNRLGGPRTHFWLDIYKSTQIGQVTDTFSTVDILDNRFPQKVHGGTIRAKAVQNLSLPLVPNAHGRRPRVYERETGNKLFRVTVRATGNSFLARSLGKSLGVEMVYLLRPEVNQAKDPRALPSEAEIGQAAVDGAREALGAGSS